MTKKKYIKTGTIDEDKLLKLFATPAQQRKYNEFGHFTSSNKKTILKEASRWCSIQDIGNKQYEISEVYKIASPKLLPKMQTGLYQYMIPLILTKLIDGHDENNKINLTCSKWARQIEMINDNYNVVKFNKSIVGDYFDYKYENIEDFYSKADEMISRYLETSLKHLTESSIIIWRKVDMVHKEIVDESKVEVDGSNIVAKVIQDKHIATEEEMGYYAQCINIAEKEANIDEGDIQSRYYGKKAKIFNFVLSRELKKKNIKFIYKTYEVYYLGLDRCKNLLSFFPNVNDEAFINSFNKDFQKLLVENAELRYKKKTDQLEINKCIKMYSEDYIDTFVNLSDITINNKTEPIRERLKLENSEYKLKVSIQTGKID